MKSINNDDDFDQIIELIKLSENVKNATNKTIDDIAEIVYTKLQLNLDEYFFQDHIHELREETNNEIALIKSTYGGNPYNKTKLQQEIESSKELKLHIRNVIEVRKTLDKIEGQFDLDSEDLELCSIIANLTTYHICMKARKDLIPLIHRGSYSSDIINALNFWTNNKKSESGKLENTWQIELTKRKEILEIILGGKFYLLNDQASVSSTDIKGTGNKIADYLFHNKGTHDIALVEIKTPHTPLLGSTYRNTYPLSKELSGSVAQVLVQKNELLKNYYQKIYKSDVKFEANSPKCFIVTGSIENEIGNDKEKAKAFELQRQAVSPSVNIISFDELYDNFSKFNRVVV